MEVEVESEDNVDVGSETDQLFKFKNKVRKVLSLDKDALQLLKELQNDFQDSFVISSSFQDIVESNLDKRKRTKQLLIMLAVGLIAIPLYSYQCYLYLISQEKRVRYQYIPDVFGESGVLGKLCCFVLTVFWINIIADNIVLRSAESRNMLEFLTDLRYLVQEQGYFGLEKREIQKLLSILRVKILCFRDIVPLIWDGSMLL